MIKISSLSVHNYYANDVTGNFSVTGEGFSTVINMDKEDCERIFAVAIEIFAKRGEAIAEAVRNVELPALIGYNAEKTIDNDEIPF